MEYIVFAKKLKATEVNGIIGIKVKGILVASSPDEETEEKFI